MQERTSLTISFLIELIAYAIGTGFNIFMAWRGWDSYPEWASIPPKQVNTETRHRFRYFKVTIAAAFANILMFCMALFFLIGVRENNAALTDSLITANAYVRFVYAAVSTGLLVFAVSKYFFLNDSLTWLVTLNAFFAIANLGAATFTSLASSGYRWSFFAVACGFMLVFDIFFMFFCHFGEVYQTGTTRHAMLHDDHKTTRGFVKLWVWILIAAVFLNWFLCVFGLGNLNISNNVWEQSWYAGIMILLFVFTPIVITTTSLPIISESVLAKNIRNMGNQWSAALKEGAPVRVFRGARTDINE
jgi:hypothetical protein